MRVFTRLTTMPPAEAAWSLLHDRRVLVIAFALSAALHLSVWLATPYFIHAWREPAAARYDAVLIPAVESPTLPTPAPRADSKQTLKGARATAARPARAPKSLAGFIAPENALAVDWPVEPAETGDGSTEAVTATGREQTPATAESNTNLPVSELLAEAPPPVISDAPEQVMPDPPPQLPARISIAYTMTSSISDGLADYSWTREGDRFEIDSSMRATGFVVGNFVGILHQVSKGRVTPTGLQPESFQIRRGDGAPDSAHFLRASNELKLTRAGEARLLPLPPLIQDMQSFLFQLAYDAPKLRHADDRLEVLVTNGRKVYRHRFRQVGTDVVETRSGPMKAIHLRSEAGDPEDTYEVWLATDNYFLPVRIKFFAGRFPVELIAASIRTAP